MARRAVAEGRHRLVKPFAVMILIIFAENFALLFDGNIRLFRLAGLWRALECLLDVFVTDRAKPDSPVQQTRQLISRFFGAFLRSGLKYDSLLFDDDRADAALNIAGGLEPNVAAVALINEIVAIREAVNCRLPIKKIEDCLGKDKRLSVTGDELRTGRQRDAFQP